MELSNQVHLRCRVRWQFWVHLSVSGTPSSASKTWETTAWETHAIFNGGNVVAKCWWFIYGISRATMPKSILKNFLQHGFIDTWSLEMYGTSLKENQTTMAVKTTETLWWEGAAVRSATLCPAGPDAAFVFTSVSCIQQPSPHPNQHVVFFQTAPVHCSAWALWKHGDCLWKLLVIKTKRNRSV